MAGRSAAIAAVHCRVAGKAVHSALQPSRSGTRADRQREDRAWQAQPESPPAEPG